MKRRITKIGAAVLIALAALSLWRSAPVGPAHWVSYAGGGEYRVSVVLWQHPNTDAQRHKLFVWYAQKCGNMMMGPVRHESFFARRIDGFPYWTPAHAFAECSA